MGEVIGTSVQTIIPAQEKNGESINSVKSIVFETNNLADAGDTVPITLSHYNITTVLGVTGYKHTTDNSVIVKEQPTTAVAAGILTITVPAGSDDDKRIYEVYYI